MIAEFAEHSAIRSSLAAGLLVIVACVGLTDAKSAAISAPTAGVETYVVTFRGTGDFSPTSAGALLDAFNENHPKGVRTHHFSTQKRDGYVVGSIHVDGGRGRDAVVKHLVASSKLKLLEVAKARSPMADRGSGNAGDTHIVVFTARGKFKPQTATELLDGFNENHPRGVRTHHFRTRVEQRADKPVLVGSICVDSKADADAVAEYVKKSEMLEACRRPQAVCEGMGGIPRIGSAIAAIRRRRGHHKGHDPSGPGARRDTRGRHDRCCNESVRRAHRSERIRGI